MQTSRSPKTLRIDVLLQDSEVPNFTRAFDVVREQGGATLGVGRYPGRVIDGKPVCYLKIGARYPRKIAARLAKAGYRVLGLHA